MSGGDAPGGLVSFEHDGDTIRVHDEIERQSMDIEVDGEFEIQPALTDAFLFPVDEAVSVTASRVRIDGPHGHASAWNETGEHIGYFHDQRLEQPEGAYYLNVTGSVLTYFHISEASVTMLPGKDGVPESPLEIVLDSPSPIRIGARSFHTRPEATVTVPDEPTALLEALPYLASSIKEFSSERSWPTLRGHPPAIERGETLHIPSGLRKPETGVTIGAPAEYAALYRIAPLAFYLGADLVEADRPTLHLENGYSEPLETSTYSLEERVDGLLARCFLLDSLVRTDGYIPTDRCDYDEIAGTLSFYPPNLYGESLSSQLLEYLEVAETGLEPHYPCWPMTAVLRPEPTDVELLPYLLHELARIHVKPSDDLDAVDLESQPEPGSSLVTACTHPSPPSGTCRLHAAAFENVFEYGRPSPGEARPAIVTDDTCRADRFRTATDLLEAETYSGDVTIVDRPTRADLEHILGAGYDFLFCDLPVEVGGFVCADGVLDPRAIDSIDVMAVTVTGDTVLDVTTSLVDRGAVVGLVLANAVSPQSAIQCLYGLLRGFPLVEAARLARITDVSRCRFVGNPSFSVVQIPGRTPAIIDIDSIDQSEHDFSYRSVETDKFRLGGTGDLDPDIESLSRLVDQNMIEGVSLGGTIFRQQLPIHTSDVVKFLESEDVVRLNGRLILDDDPTEELVRESAQRSINQVQ